MGVAGEGGDLGDGEVVAVDGGGFEHVGGADEEGVGGIGDGFIAAGHLEEGAFDGDAGEGGGFEMGGEAGWRAGGLGYTLSCVRRKPA